MAEAPLLELDGVEARYGPVKALHGVSLSLGEGEVAAVLGAARGRRPARAPRPRAPRPAAPARPAPPPPRPPGRPLGRPRRRARGRGGGGRGGGAAGGGRAGGPGPARRGGARATPTASA